MTALEIAFTQIGKQEVPKGSNWGEDVRKYLLSAGINFPASWCMAFVYWCVQERCSLLGIRNNLYKTGGVLSMWNNIENKFKVKPPLFKEELLPGDIFILDFGHGVGHTGFIEKYLGRDHYQTIEGNTNDTGSREGFEVCRKERNSLSFHGIIRLT